MVIFRAVEKLVSGAQACEALLWLEFQGTVVPVAAMALGFTVLVFVGQLWITVWSIDTHVVIVSLEYRAWAKSLWWWLRCPKHMC
jgi:hypothetical protein